MSRVAAYERLVEQGCLCGAGRPQDCPVHPESGDNRGLRAFFEAGMPLAFPSPMTCGRCGAEGLSYPGDAEQVGAGLVCPNCSVPACESFMRFKASQVHKLNERCVFTTEPHLLVESPTESRLGEPESGETWEPITDPDEYLRALHNLPGHNLESAA